MSSRADPSWVATRDDLRRLAWVLALVWLALAAFTALAQRYLGWGLAVGLVGGAGLLFTLGLLLVAAGSVAAASLERRRTSPGKQSLQALAVEPDRSADEDLKP
jgi:hypothetical protein